jgi:hypothetical protein
VNYGNKVGDPTQAGLFSNNPAINQMASKPKKGKIPSACHSFFLRVCGEEIAPSGTKEKQVS